MEEHDFRPYFPDGEKELMINDSERPLGVISGFSISDRLQVRVQIVHCIVHILTGCLKINVVDISPVGPFG